MSTVTDIIVQYQTSSPFELAKKIGLEVRHDEFDKKIRGIYYPSSTLSILVLNKLSSSAVQKFILSYYLHAKLSKYDFNIHSCTDIKQIALQSAFFAGDLLNENDEFRNRNIRSYYVEAGVSPTLANALEAEWVASGRSRMGKSSLPYQHIAHL